MSIRLKSGWWKNFIFTWTIPLKDMGRVLHMALYCTQVNPKDQSKSWNTEDVTRVIAKVTIKPQRICDWSSRLAELLLRQRQNDVMCLKRVNVATCQQKICPDPEEKDQWSLPITLYLPLPFAPYSNPSSHYLVHSKFPSLNHCSTHPHIYLPPLWVSPGERTTMYPQPRAKS